MTKYKAEYQNHYALWPREHDTWTRLFQGAVKFNPRRCKELGGLQIETVDYYPCFRVYE